MSPLSTPALRLVFAVAAACVAAGVPAAQGGGSEAQARYQQDRAACNSGQTGQDRATCLKEAGAAQAEARRGNLDEERNRRELSRNRMDRCNALTGDERSDCVARMRGEGTVEGSVSGGGILREKVTIVPGTPDTQGASGTK
jgi:hypothetical protein